ncbi:hypothetical protein Q1695_002174 [Nippostrongylus brasiliensis]|nr:hypothetical protein Q1695_002174 [Nippostrongylus brasiliensis]
MRLLLRRRRESMFHRLWICLVVTCGVLMLILLNMSDNKEKVPSVYATIAVTAYQPSTDTHPAPLTLTIKEIQEKSMKMPALPSPPPVVISKTPFYEHIIVHFDLKGAPPKFQYFLDLLRLVAKAGATGILLEWEDMFPWSGELEIARSTHAYTEQEVRVILQKATQLGLEVIPLVQTFGHMEWVLKYEKFREYREVDEYPQVICIGNEKATEIAKEAIRQVVKMHKPYGLKRFHIGADEAFMFGQCKDSLDIVQKIGKNALALSHLKNITEFTKSITNNATILAWHDMLKGMSVSEIKDFKLRDLLQPVIWDYSERIVTMSDWDFSYMQEKFTHLWASSAFKGANHPGANVMDMPHYMANNMEWIDRMRELRPKNVTFQGVIITGWSRYDHLARLCEIWPAATISMIVNVQFAKIGARPKFAEYDRIKIKKLALKATEKILQCTIRDDGSGIVACGFNGFSVYKLIQQDMPWAISRLNASLTTNHHILGWLSSYNVEHNTSQNWYLRQIQPELVSDVFALYRTARALEKELSLLFHNETVDEFIFSNYDEELTKARRYITAIKKLSELRLYERRSFKIHRLDLSMAIEELKSYQSKYDKPKFARELCLIYARFYSVAALLRKSSVMQQCLVITVQLMVLVVGEYNETKSKQDAHAETVLILGHFTIPAAIAISTITVILAGLTAWTCYVDFSNLEKGISNLEVCDEDEEERIPQSFSGPLSSRATAETSERESAVKAADLALEATQVSKVAVAPPRLDAQAKQARIIQAIYHASGREVPEMYRAKCVTPMNEPLSPVPLCHTVEGIGESHEHVGSPVTTLTMAPDALLKTQPSTERTPMETPKTAPTQMISASDLAKAVTEKLEREQKTAAASAAKQQSAAPPQKSQQTSSSAPPGKPKIESSTGSSSKAPQPPTKPAPPPEKK